MALGNFLWGFKARARCEELELETENQRFFGSHDGYTRLPDPVIHRRMITMMGDRKIEVVDTLECKGSHEVTVHIHLSDACDVRPIEEEMTVRASAKGHSIVIRGEKLPSLLRGDDVRPAGWVSHLLGEKEPTYTLAWTYAIVGTTEIITTIEYFTGNLDSDPST